MFVVLSKTLFVDISETLFVDLDESMLVDLSQMLLDRYFYNSLEDLLVLPKFVDSIFDQSHEDWSLIIVGLLS